MKIYKTAITTVLCCLILINFQSEAKNSANSNLDLISLKKQGYQIFNKDNFVIKCNSKLKINSEALRLAKEKGMNFILSSYIGSDNENSESTGVIYNIQISDISSQYQNFPVSKQNEITIKYLDSYCSGLKANKMSYTRQNFNGLNSVEYSYLQNGVLPKNRVKIIMVTALANTELVDKAFEYGCEAYAAKPIDIDKFIEVLNKIGIEKKIQNTINFYKEFGGKK